MSSVMPKVRRNSTPLSDDRPTHIRTIQPNSTTLTSNVQSTQTIQPLQGSVEPGWMLLCGELQETGKGGMAKCAVDSFEQNGLWTAFIAGIKPCISNASGP